MFSISHAALESLPVRLLNRCWPARPGLTASVKDWVRNSGGGRVIAVRPAVEHELPLPSGGTAVDDVFRRDRSFVLPERYVAMIPGASLRGRDGFVVLPDGSYATEVAPAEWLRPHPAYRQRIQAKATRVEGPCFSLLSIHCREYYHWMIDGLTRLFLTRELLPRQTRFIVPSGLRSDQERMLEQLGIPEASILRYASSEPIVCDELWFAPLVSPDRFQDPAAVQWLQGLLWPELREQGWSQQRRRVFISRRQAPTRRCLNEEILYPALADRGFQVIRPEEMPIEEQIRLFASAEVVVGPHGAGFTNVLFCRPGTRVAEIFPGEIGFRTYYWSLAAAAGCGYHYMKAGSSPSRHGPNHADTIVDLAEVEYFLDEVTKGLPA